MKTTKRILTLALALVMIMAMAIPALADTIETGISVTGDGNTTYEVFKIFDIEPVANGNKYKLTTDWADFTASGYFTVTENGYAVWDKDTVSVADAAAIAQLAKNYAEQKSLTTQTTVTVGEQIETEAGYFLLVPENGPCGVVLVEQGSVTTVEEKSTATGQPVVVKHVKEDSLDQYATSNTADIGQILDYQIVITAGENAENYILHDKMDAHIVPTTNSMKVTRDGNELTRDTDFEVIMNPGDDCGCTFHVKFSENICKSLHEDAKLVITYTGKLTEDADAEHPHTNTTWLTYTAANAPSNESTVVTETYKIIVKKVDNTDQKNPLAGAGFVLVDNIGRFYFWNETDKKVEWVTVQPEPTMTGTDGIVEFNGVDAENFTLKEVVVPDGYIGTTDISVSTKGTEKIVNVQVVNTLGDALPETGGVGTPIFYVTGIVLVLGALAVMVVTKRKDNVQ